MGDRDQTRSPTIVFYNVGAAEANDPLGWIIARYEDRQYVEGNDPCLNQVPMPRRLTFEYDRQAAAHYAIEHSYQNDGLSNPTQGGRVTRKLTNPSLRFADFTYSFFPLTGTPSPGNTGSAVFISEAFWMGGMPMTQGASPLGTCDANLNTEAGWCWAISTQGGNGNSSNPWDKHEQIVAYFTNTIAPITVTGYNVSNNVIIGGCS
jgi:hypothetical protein